MKKAPLFRAMPVKCCCSKWLEVNLYRELRLSAGRGTRDSSEVGTGEVAVRIIEVGVIEDIVALESKLQVASLAAGPVNVLVDSGVGVHEARSMVLVARDVPE